MKLSDFELFPNASSMYDTHLMVLGNNVKNLVILIPNEAHEPVGQQKNQLPLANQPYIPQKIQDKSTSL